MFKINLQLCFFLTFNYFHGGATVNYRTFDNKHHHLLQATNSDNDDSNEHPFYQHNPRGNSNYQQMYPYYYTPPNQVQQRLQTLPPTQLWFGPPIVVEEDTKQQHQPSTNIPSMFNQQQYTPGSTIRSSELPLPLQYSHSKVLPPFYNPQSTTRTNQFNYDSSNNNSNNLHHRDFIHQIDAAPESQSLNNRQQQQQFVGANTNLHYNGVSNDLAWLRKYNVPDYREHFNRYLKNNPQRIKPIF